MRNNSYNKIQFKCINSTLISIIEIKNYANDNFVLQNITILGIIQGPLIVQVNGFPFSHYFYNKTEKVSWNIHILNID